jgi:hypothetical protein
MKSLLNKFIISALVIGIGFAVQPPIPAQAQRAAIALTVQTSGYEAWGRPAGMDNPNAGCGSFNDARPVSKFNVSLQIKNNAASPMSNWYLTVLKANGKEAYVCYYGYENGFPNVAAGQIVNVTFAAFMEPGETAARIFLTSSLGRSGEIRFDAQGKPTTNTSAAASSRQTTPKVTGKIGIVIQSSGYENWGRPAGMDNPNAGCSSFDDSRPVRKFNASLGITNNTARPMSNWYARVFKANGKEAYVCYYGYENGFPTIAPGQTVNMTFAAFVEGGESVARLWIEDATAGRSSVLTIR